ncbi:hypothetical protein [Streptomyces sp. NRRL B-24484]|uniref:hypothetical protein n=1 Tax=Streptomyces sp. NRRL B-24484 TaxID=1463833 RepID=UPI00133121E1|nr:hypothetical protein [Streptomyces sp. NRRL B-24484]
MRTRHDIWAMLRRHFPGSKSSRCTVAANELVRQVLEPAVQPREANELRAAISEAVTAGIRRPLEQHDQQWVVESILGQVVVGLAGDRNLLAAAVADVLPFHQDHDGTCPEYGSPSPCPPCGRSAAWPSGHGRRLFCPSADSTEKRRGPRPVWTAGATQAFGHSMTRRARPSGTASGLDLARVPRRTTARRQAAAVAP